MGTRHIDLPTGRLTLYEERGYVHLVHAPGCNVTRKDAVELIDAHVELTSGRRYPLLVDVSKCKSVNFEARSYFSLPQVRVVYSALALVGGSPVGNMLANFGLAMLSKADGSPIKMFTSERDALEWLTRFIVQ